MILYAAPPHLRSAQTLSDLFTPFPHFLVPLPHDVFQAYVVDRTSRLL